MPSVRKKRKVKENSGGKFPYSVKLNGVNPGDTVYLEIFFESDEPKSLYYELTPEMIGDAQSVNFHLSGQDIKWLRITPRQITRDEMPPVFRVPRKRGVGKAVVPKPKKKKKEKPVVDPNWRIRGSEIVLVFNAEGILITTARSPKFVAENLDVNGTLTEQFIDYLCKSREVLQPSGFSFRYYRSSIGLTVDSYGITLRVYDALCERKRNN